MHKAYSIALVIGLLCLLGVPALGAPILVYNTGLGAASPGDQDQNWTVQSGPAYEVIGSASAWFPFNGWWLLNDGVSQWIAPQPAYDGGPTDAGGNYIFRTTFSLSGMIPSTAQIQGRWLTDNQGVNIYLNAQALGLTTPLSSFQAWSVFNILAGSLFEPGMNTLDFVVYNIPQDVGNPVGLRVELSGTAADMVIPEPGTFALLGIGLVGVGIFYRRRKRA